MSGTSVTALVTALLDEGLKIRRFPGVVYRNGPAGRRAGLVRGPDVWEVGSGRCGQRRDGGSAASKVSRKSSGLALDDIRVAVDFYAAFPDEIDARIVADEQVQAGLREAIDRRERLLSS